MTSPVFTTFPHAGQPQQQQAPPLGVSTASGQWPPPADGGGFDEVEDFSLPPRRRRFRIDGETYDAVPRLGVPQMRQLAQLHSKMDKADTAGKFELTLQMLRLLLTRESGERLLARIEDPDNPIDVRGQLMPLLSWLVESQGLRPTQGSGSSSGGPSTTGGSLTAGAPPVESTPAASPSTGS